MKKQYIDRTKLVTPSNYAKKIGKSRGRVYELIRSKEIKSIIIDGVIFVESK